MTELFITGTNKTLITTGLALTMQSLGYSVGVYKPICTGVTGTPKEFALLNKHIKTYTTYEFEEDREPFMAAFAQNQPIQPLELLADFKKLDNEITFIEGTNGPQTRIAENFTEETMIKWFQVPVLFVVSAKNVPTDIIRGIRGIIITDYTEQYKFLPQVLEKNTGVRVMGILKPLAGNISPEDLIAEIITKIDLEAALNMKIAKL